MNDVIAFTLHHVVLSSWEVIFHNLEGAPDTGAMCHLYSPHNILHVATTGTSVYKISHR